MKVRATLGLVTSLLVGIRAAGSEQRIVLQAGLHGPRTEQPAEFSAVLSLESVSDAGQPPVRLPLTVPGAVETTLQPGVWRAEVSGDGLFHQPQLITVSPSSPLHSRLEIWQTATVTGRLNVTDGALPKRIEVRWSATGSPSVPAPPTAARTCSVDSGTFTCQIPIGILDLRLRAQGHVSKYLWGIRVAGDSRELGQFLLERGASIVGWIKPEHGVTGDLTAAVVEIRSETPGKPITTPVNDRGFFHVERIAPGDYVLSARLGEFAADSRTVHVSEGSESELIDEVILSRPRALTVRVQPARSAADRAWQMRLERVHAADRTEAVARGETDASGRIAWKNIRPGLYTVVVAEDSRSVVAVHELEVAGDRTEFSIDVPRTPVTGRVTIRDRGVEMRLWLGGRNRLPSVEVRTDEDGRFSATVPFDPAEEWLVSLESKAPRVVRTLRVKPSLNEATGEARLEIALPGSVIAGRVVDERGKAADRAIVNVVEKTPGGQSLLQTNVDAGGAFEFDGLEKGTYELQASDFQQQQSDLLTVVLGEDPFEDVELVVRKKRSLTGRVVTASGQPVPNVEVTAFPADRRFMHVASAMTDSDGIFTLNLAPDTRGTDFMIAANGLALKTFHVPVPESGLTIVTDSTGGQVVFDVPQFVDDPSAVHPYFVHKGAVIPVRALVYQSAARAEPSKRGGSFLSLTHPLVDDGDYSVCMLAVHELPSVRASGLPRGRCASGYLSPWGNLRLETPSPE